MGFYARVSSYVHYCPQRRWQEADWWGAQHIHLSPSLSGNPSPHVPFDYVTSLGYDRASLADVYLCICVYVSVLTVMVLQQGFPPSGVSCCSSAVVVKWLWMVVEKAGLTSCMTWCCCSTSAGNTGISSVGCWCKIRYSRKRRKCRAQLLEWNMHQHLCITAVATILPHWLRLGFIDTSARH